MGPRILHIPFLILVLASGTRSHAVECEHPDLRTMSVSASRSMSSALYVAPDFTRNPADGSVVEGAVYDERGMVVCVLPGDPKAYRLRGFARSGYLATECADIEARLKAGDTAGAGVEPLPLSNSDLLRRLAWMMAEGACYPVKRQCVPNAATCAGPVAQSSGGGLTGGGYTLAEFGSRYFAYAQKFGRERYPSEDAWRRGMCIDATGSRADEYFMKWSGPALHAWRAIRHPGRWQPYPDAGSTYSCPAGSPNDVYDCHNSRLAPRCLMDIIAAVRDTTNAHSPFGTSMPTNWVSDMLPGVPASTDHGKNCGNSKVRIAVRSWAGTQAIHCFYRL